MYFEFSIFNLTCNALQLDSLLLHYDLNIKYQLIIYVVDSSLTNAYLRNKFITVLFCLVHSLLMNVNIYFMNEVK